MMNFVVVYFCHTLTLPKLAIKSTLKKVELVTSWPKLAIEILEDRGHIERHRK